MEAVEKIIILLDERKIKASTMMKDLGFSSGLFSQWKNKKQKPSSEKISKIANYLGVSVDYLLGRTDTPQIQSNINTGNIGNNNNSSVTISSAAKDSDMTEDFLKIFKKLPFEEKLKIMNYAMDIKNGGDKA